MIRTCQKCDISTNYMCVDYADEIACCNSDDDCKRTEICENNQCVFDQPGCEKDADCAQGEKCLDGDCITWPVSCSTDKECEYLGDYECVDEKCEKKGNFWEDNLGLIGLGVGILILGAGYFISRQPRYGGRPSYTPRRYSPPREPTRRREEYVELGEDYYRKR
jgi:hypothetical protein